MDFVGSTSLYYYLVEHPQVVQALSGIFNKEVFPNACKKVASLCIRYDIIQTIGTEDLAGTSNNFRQFRSMTCILRKIKTAPECIWYTKIWGIVIIVE